MSQAEASRCYHWLLPTLEHNSNWMSWKEVRTLPVPGVTSDDTQYVDSGSGPEEQEGKKGKVITDDDVTSEQSHTGKKSACSLWEWRKRKLCIRCLKTQHNQLLFSQLQRHFVTSRWRNLHHKPIWRTAASCNWSGDIVVQSLFVSSFTMVHYGHCYYVLYG